MRQDTGKVNYWGWQPGARFTFGISYSNLIFITPNDSESQGLFSLTKDHGHAGLPFHLCHSVLCYYDNSICCSFFCFVLFHLWWPILSLLPDRPHYVGCWYLSCPCWFWRLGWSLTTYKRERCSEPCPGDASMCSVFIVLDEAQHCQLMFWLWWYIKPQTKTN